MVLAVTLGSLIAVAIWELLQPRRQLEFPAWRRRLGNLGIWLCNIIAAALIFSPRPALLVWPFGPVAAFLFLDLLSYAVHRAQHAVPLLWRLHALHHSDPDLDWTSSVRHHPAEFLIATGYFWLAVLALGIPVSVATIHGTTVFVLAALTHANTALWPAFVERLLSPIIITLELHLIHHSLEAEHYNSNFGSIFSLWDRIFRTYKWLPSAQVERLTFGVQTLSRREACKPLVMLLTPLRVK